MSSKNDIVNAVIDYIDNQICLDYKNASVGKPTSLLAKWMPSCNTSSSETRALAKKIYTALKLSEKEYRKMLSKIRAELKVIEVDASAKKWSAIDYEKVPSMANLKYKNAFLRNDEARRREYLAKLDKGEAKINSSVAFPCDIVHNYVTKNTNSYGYYGCNYNNIQIDSALEAMWKSLPDFVKANDHATSTIVCADDSGSMIDTASGNMTMLTVAQSLAIYFSEKLTGPYKDKCITFSGRPQYLDFTNCKSLIDKIKVMYSHSEVSNTNIEAVYDLILQTAIDNNLKQEDIPANILLVSDMEFDSMVNFNGCSRYGSYDNKYYAKQCALFEQIKKRYEAANLIMPRTVFWNVGSRTGTVPIQEHKTGTALVSGYSPAIAKMVFSAKTDPYEVLLETLDTERYAVIEEAIKNVI